MKFGLAGSHSLILHRSAESGVADCDLRMLDSLSELVHLYLFLFVFYQLFNFEKVILLDSEIGQVIVAAGL